MQKSEKDRREKPSFPVKKTQKWQKKAFTPVIFFTPKKKTLLEYMLDLDSPLLLSDSLGLSLFL